ncbi:DUF3667 domain-containing protein [Psychroserpens damuponensis]|uniref:DUF3667 domain-containing protein n=1 Tax=Psychroserpens damuponensis TaxID=943936 RepID=UPI001379390C|nr:DUF3667 domain-containing protein [Psychroserpens damuponensis]
MKNLWEDVSLQFLNIDNKFLKTFTHLFTQPETIINGFIEGTRKKYINVIQYFAISLTLVGIQVFLMNTFFSDDLAHAMDFIKPFEKATGGKENPYYSSLASLEEINNYQSIIYICTVPIYTLATWLAYKIIKPVRRYNFTEHLVLNLYYNAQVIIITALLSILFLCFGFNYLLISGVVTFLVFIYLFWILKRVFNVSYLEGFAHFLLVMCMFTGIFLMVGVGIGITGIIIGYTN